MNLPDQARSYLLRILLFHGFPEPHGRDHIHFQKGAVVLLNHPGSNIGQLHLSKRRNNIIFKQTDVACVCRQGPLVFSIQFDVLPDQLLDRSTASDIQFSLGFRVLDIVPALLGLRFGTIRFPFLLSVALLRLVVIDDTVMLSSLNDTCHHFLLFCFCLYFSYQASNSRRGMLIHWPTLRAGNSPFRTHLETVLLFTPQSLLISSRV